MPIDVSFATNETINCVQKTFTGLFIFISHHVVPEICPHSNDMNIFYIIHICQGFYVHAQSGAFSNQDKDS